MKAPALCRRCEGLPRLGQTIEATAHEAEKAQVTKALQLLANLRLHMAIAEMERAQLLFMRVNLGKLKLCFAERIDDEQNVQRPSAQFRTNALQRAESLEFTSDCTGSDGHPAQDHRNTRALRNGVKQDVATHPIVAPRRRRERRSFMNVFQRVGKTRNQDEIGNAPFFRIVVQRKNAGDFVALEGLYHT